MNMAGKDLAEGLLVGVRVLRRRVFPGGQGRARRYALACRCCGAEAVMTHAAICTRLRMLTRGMAEVPCAACAAVAVPVPALAGRRMTWGRKVAECWRPASVVLPPGMVSPAVAWPLPGQAARP